MFAAIDSSPISFDDTESQNLTDHQKETRERQVHEAAMFPKLGSSPTPNDRNTPQKLPRLMLSGKDKPRGPTEPDDQTSPMLPVIDGELEAFLGSSPTPRSSKKLSSDPLSDGGPPSSPPGVPSLAATFPRQAEKDPPSAVEEEQVQVEAQSESNNRFQAPQGSPAIAQQTRDDAANDEEAVVLNQHDGAASLPGGEQQQVAEDEVASTKAADTRILSDFDIFVDAPTEPIEGKDATSDKTAVLYQEKPTVSTSPTPGPTPAAFDEFHDNNTAQTPVQADSSELQQVNENGTSQVTDSFLSQSTQYSNDDDQITAQLAADMERASSQAERARDGARGTSSNRKRKRRGSASTATVKRLRSHSKAQECHVVVERQKPETTDDDCIILDTRSAENSTPPSSPKVKQEKLTTPASVAQQVTGTVEVPDETKDPSPQSADPKELESEATPPATARTRKSKSDDPKTLRSRAPALRRSARQSRTVEEPDQEMQDAPEVPATSGYDPAQIATSLQDQAPSPSPRKSAYQRLMDGFRNLIGDLKQVTLRAEEERAVTGVLFESILEVHEAGRRHPQS